MPDADPQLRRFVDYLDASPTPYHAVSEAAQLLEAHGFTRIDLSEEPEPLGVGARRYVQEGDVELTDLPDSPGAWEGIDVIVIGDVRADLFTTSQLEQIHDLVALRGAGILPQRSRPSSPPASGSVGSQKTMTQPLRVNLLSSGRVSAKAGIASPFSSFRSSGTAW